MRIGSIEVGPGAGLAPMAGVTDAAMRLLCCEQGSAWSVSEMLSAKGWIYSRGQNRNARQLLVRLPGEGIGGLQLFGREPEYVARAAGELQDAGFSFIDLNFGCPAPKITGNGEGSAMLREPELIGRVVAAVVAAVRIPVTVKLRAGWDASSVNAPLVARICEDAGAAAIAIHGRTREQQYAGRADWSVIREVRRCVSVPVLGNGDVRSGADAVRMMEETGCDAVLVGRAARGDPWIFASILSALRGEEWRGPTVGERVDMILRHFELETRLHGERMGLLEMRKHIAWYISGLPGASRFREAVNRMGSGEQVREALMAFAAQADTDE